MDDLAGSISGRPHADWPEWHITSQSNNNPAVRNKLSSLFEKLDSFTRQGKRIRNESRESGPPQEQKSPCRTATRNYRRFKIEPEEAIWVLPTPPKPKMLILAPVEFDYSQSLKKTRERSKELLDINSLNKKLQINKKRRLRNLSEQTGRKSTSRPISRGLDQLCVQTLRGVLFPSPRSAGTLSKTKKKEFQESLMRRLKLLKSCYDGNETIV